MDLQEEVVKKEKSSGSKRYAGYIFTAGILIIIILILYTLFYDNRAKEKVVLTEAPMGLFTNHFSTNQDEDGKLIVDFTLAAGITTPCVVNIKSSFIGKTEEHEIPEEFKEFFGDDFFFHRPGPGRSFKSETTGSGVIVNENGYIITNNHVVSEADEIEITLNDKRKFNGKIIGSDPATDLAIVKIEESKLPSIIFGNSDVLKIGEWVLAVGNPFNLSSTVTAGIVSAKGRALHILKDNYAVESFIQTDAAVNPGNSGGALVNLNGELIGINTAIATPTGTYAGYAFAIPSDIVKKVSEDLINYGIVQRGFLGVVIKDINDEIIKKHKLESFTGVFVDSILKNGAAQKAGLKSEDVIIKIDNSFITSASKLQEIISQKKPGQEISVIVIRRGKEKELKAVLQNREGTEKLLKKEERKEILNTLGVEFENLSKDDKELLGIKYGVRVGKIGPGIIKNQTDMREGFIITKVGNSPVKSADDLIKYLEKSSGGIMFEGIYPGLRGVYYYAFGVEVG